MGLTIHYTLTTKLDKPKDIRKLVEAVRQYALDLPLKEVSEIKEFKATEAGYEDKDDPDRWLKIQAGAHVVENDCYYSVPPHHVVAFSTWPGEGCEQANFGFCKYPGFITQKGRKRKATKLTGWRWSSFCKTQYASDPKCGGMENFLRCHLCVVKLLDFIKATGMVTVEVRDEGDFWEHRDLKKLAQEVGDWNVQIAGFASILRTATESTGTTIEAPITGFQSFEHLEAKGLEKLADLRRALGQEGEN